MAETVVVAYHEPAHAKPPEQHLPHEVAGGERGHLFVEVQQGAGIDARLRQQGKLLVGGAEQFGVVVGAEHTARVAVEGDGHGTQPCPARHVADVGEEVAVAAVYPVEEAHRGRARRRPLHRRRKAYYVHQLFLRRETARISSPAIITGDVQTIIHSHSSADSGSTRNILPPEGDDEPLPGEYDYEHHHEALVGQEAVEAPSGASRATWR